MPILSSHICGCQVHLLSMKRCVRVWAQLALRSWQNAIPSVYLVFCPIPTLNRSHLKSEGSRGKVWHLVGSAGVNNPRGKFHSEGALQEPRGEASPVRVGYWRWYPRQMEAGRAPRDGSTACVFMKKNVWFTNKHTYIIFISIPLLLWEGTHWRGACIFKKREFIKWR